MRGPHWPGEPLSASGDDNASTSTDAGTARDLNERLPEARKGLPALVPNKGVPALRRADIEHVSNPCQDYGSEYELGLDLIRDGSKPGSRHNPGRGVANDVPGRPGADCGRMPGHGSGNGIGSGIACDSANGVLCWVAVVEEAPSATAVVHLLADRADLIEAVTDLRWLEWGHAPEPIDREWWHAATVREAGRSELPMTWVASDQSGALGVVGLGQFDIEERRDRSPWVLGMIVRPDRRGTGIGRLLLAHLERWARQQGYEQLWVATGGAAVDFYQRCGWRIYETVNRDFESATVLTKSHEPS
jgi:GNAT superfamily N-acetyltransferase